MNRFLLIATLLVAGVVSAKSADSEMLKNTKVKIKKSKKIAKKSNSEGCFNAYYHGCTHAVACVKSIEEALIWADKIHENYCNQ